MGAKSLLLISGVAIATLLYLVYLGATFEAPEGTTTIVIPPPALQPVQEDPDTTVDATPAPVETTEDPEPAEVVEQPVVELEEDAEAVVPEPEVVQLPSLNNSDEFVLDQLRTLPSGTALLSLLSDEQLIRGFVVLVDNVSKDTLSQANIPYRQLDEELPVETVDDNLFVLDEAGYSRFNRAIDIFVEVDTDQAMSLYRLFAPLFQQAYAEIGYRNVNFDNTLRRAIRTVLNTEEVEGPFQLVKPSVMYIYADTSMENMTDIQKQMIRLGPENAEKLKTKLRQFLQQL